MLLICLCLAFKLCFFKDIKNLRVEKQYRLLFIYGQIRILRPGGINSLPPRPKTKKHKEPEPGEAAGEGFGGGIPTF